MSIVTEFAKFRMDSKKNGGGVAFTPVTSPPERPSMFELEDIKKMLMEDEQFKGFVTPEPRWFGNGSGVAPSRVQALEARIQNLENNPQSSVNYYQVTTGGTHTFNNTQLTPGINIIGVNVAGPVTVRIPDNLVAGTLVEIADESLAASSNNITIETYIDS